MVKEEFKLENQLCFRLYSASRLITQAYHPLLTKQGLTYPQYLVLLVLWEKDTQPVNDIAKCHSPAPADGEGRDPDPH